MREPTFIQVLKNRVVALEARLPRWIPVEERLPEEEEDNKRIRQELHELRYKESQQNRFIAWIRNVYAKNVMDTIAGIISACTYQDEPAAAYGKYGLPIKCFDMMRRLTEYSHEIYDDTHFSLSTGTGVKTDNKIVTIRKSDELRSDCIWVLVEDPDIDLWCTSCGNEFHIEADTPSDNHMKYCCYCGKEIVEG